MTTAAGAPVPDTAARIMHDAYIDAGIIGTGDELNSEQLSDGMRRLNKLVNYLQTKGLKLFVQEDVSLAAPILQAGKIQYTVGPVGADIVLLAKPRRVIEGYYTDDNDSRRPLILMARQEYNTLSTIASQGTITAFYPDKQLQNIIVNLWMTPDAQAATGTVHLIIDEQIANFSQLTDTMQFPAEWQLTLEWGLSHQVSTGQPQSIIDRCEKNAAFYQEELENWDVEDASTVFQPDPRSQYVGKRFTY